MTFFFLRLGERARDLTVIKIYEDLFFGKHLRVVSVVLGRGLEHSCLWPRKGRSLALDCFVSLALASTLLSKTPPLLVFLSHLLEWLKIKPN